MIMKIHNGKSTRISVCVKGCRSNCSIYCPYVCMLTDICDNQCLFKLRVHNYATYLDDK